MPMEESANMLLMLAAIVQRLNTTDFLQPYWKIVDAWAQYLNSTLPDPGNQLCTDDFVCHVLLSITQSDRSYLIFFRKDHLRITATWH